MEPATKTVAYESRMLIDGELTEASGGATYDNINPATEEVIGPVADGNEADMDRAITAARQAFDETSWSTDKAFRKACLVQLKDALGKYKEDLRPQIVAEVGAPSVSRTRSSRTAASTTCSGTSTCSTSTNSSTSSGRTSSSA